jgi:hypothetical protein
MHNQNRQSLGAIRLPMATAENFNAGLNFDETFLGSRKQCPPPNKKAGYGLDMSTAQAAAGPKSSWTLIRLRSRHN